MADLVLVPLLELQRRIYDLPRGRERFDLYIATLRNGGDHLLPISAMNPMAKEAAPAAFDRLLVLDAEAVARAALAEASSRLSRVEGRLRVGLTVADDLQGGWTHRHTTEAAARFERGAASQGWASVLTWSSESPGAAEIRQETLATVYRVLHQVRHGVPRTLQAMLEQEGRAAAFAGCLPTLDGAVLAGVRRRLDPLRPSRDYPVQFAALYGDRIAKGLGYDALGLPDRAGFEVALADALIEGRVETHLGQA